MAIESKKWNPAHWSHTKTALFIRHVDQHFERAMADILSIGMSHVLMAEIRGKYSAALGVTMINAAGYKTIGQA